MLNTIRNFIDSRNNPLTEVEEMLYEEASLSHLEDVILSENDDTDDITDEDMVDDVLDEFAGEDDDTEIAKIANSISDDSMSDDSVKLTDADTEKASREVSDPTLEQLAAEEDDMVGESYDEMFDEDIDLLY